MGEICCIKFAIKVLKYRLAEQVNGYGKARIDGQKSYFHRFYCFKKHHYMILI